MSISNLGGIGGTAFTPIVNWPEVAILGISRGVFEPGWNGTEFEPRQLLPLSLSYDHRRSTAPMRSASCAGWRKRSRIRLR